MWLRSPRLRRAVALASVVLATGGLVLYRAEQTSASTGFKPAAPLVANGKNSVAFHGPGAHGVMSLSHTKVLSGATTPVYAEIRMQADQAGEARERAPISLAVVLDTSGSMGGEKIEDAKRSVLRLLSDMRDDDEIALVRYSDTSELVQPLARVGSVRYELAQKIRNLQADGGTNIPGGLSSGLRALDDAARGRVRRMVLVSDGLDSTRAQAESLARTSFSSGITVSSLGIGLDFDEAYMGSIAQSGHGNFAYIKDGTSLAGFLKRELEQTSTTMVENVRVRMTLPSGTRFVSALGADATVHGDEVELAIGSIFAGDERRVVVELQASAHGSLATTEITSAATWNKVGGTTASVAVPPLTLVATNDASEVERGRDGAVFASAMSVIASRRQVEAQNAYANGDVARATALTTQNAVDLGVAASAAPPEAMPAIQAQMQAYAKQKQGFAAVPPKSAAGRAATKAAAEKDFDNLNRKAF